MGKAAQVRGTFQVVDLRTLNAELSELLKLDIDEVGQRSVKEFNLTSGTADQLVDWTDAGIDVANLVYIVASCPLMVKFNNVLGEAIAVQWMLQKGEIKKLYLSAPVVGVHVRIIALEKC
jgi:hypothetical protein